MLDKAQELLPQMIAWRRDFHMYPELGFEEVRTAAKIAELMKSWGYRVRTGVGKTGVVAELGTGKPVVAIRADMDALPISEANNVPYKSKNAGVMHACGHDAHMSMALATAKILSQEDLSGTVRFLFQPAEEIQDDEGFSGAPRMIQDGAIEGVDYALALHVDADLSTGTVEMDTFAAAGVDTFYARIIGRGGHGSAPHQVIDPILISAYVVMAIHNIVSRRLWPFDPAVISIGSINGGQATNVIPQEIKLSGTIRFISNEVQEQVHTELKKVMEISKIMGGDYELEILEGYPVMNNHPEVIAQLKSVAGELIGIEKLIKPMPEMGAEDFGFFIKDIPGAMFFLGCRMEDVHRRHHDPKFDVNEACLPVGVAIFAETTLRLMKNHG